VNASLEAAFHGAVYGAIATAPMSAVMLIGQRLGWMDEHPPEALTEGALRRADALEEKSKGTVDLLAVASHFAFGAAGGALFGLLSRHGAPGAPRLPMGIAFGVGVWATSYRGWIPALDMLPPEQRRGRAGTTAMIAAHAVYGATLGALEGTRGLADRPAWRLQNGLLAHRRG
jgi:hypothetical protein